MTVDRVRTDGIACVDRMSATQRKRKAPSKYSEAQWQFLDFPKIFRIQGLCHSLFPPEEPLGKTFHPIQYLPNLIYQFSVPGLVSLSKFHLQVLNQSSGLLRSLQIETGIVRTPSPVPGTPSNPNVVDMFAQHQLT